MRGNWDAVRDKACSLYAEGRSLKEVQGILLVENDFEASERAFRNKLKEWNAKKTTLTSKARSTLIRDIAARVDEQTDTVEVVHNGSRSGVDSWSMQASGNQFRPERRDFRRSHIDINARPTNSCQPQPNITDLYERIRTKADDPRTRNRLSAVLSTDAAGPLIHYAASRHERRQQRTDGEAHTRPHKRQRTRRPGLLTAQEEPTVLTRVLSLAQYQGLRLDVNVRDTDGFSPLELAIISGSKANVDILLEAGASLSVTNSKFEQPLHFAIRHQADWSVCESLLQRGANVNGPLHLGSSSVSPLLLAANAEHTTFTSAQGLYNYLCILNGLIAKKACFDARSDEGIAIYKHFLLTINRSSLWLADTLDLLVDSLKHFLRKGCSPLIEVPIVLCPTKSCRSLAASIFYHAPLVALSESLMEGCDVAQYGTDLLNLLLDPCRSRCNGHYGAQPAELVKRLMTAGYRPGFGLNPMRYELPMAHSARKIDLVRTLLSSGRNLLCHVIAKSPDDCKVGLMEALLYLGYDLIHATDPHYGRPLTALIKVEPPLRYRLAEILLEPDYRIWESSSAQRRMSPPQLFAYDPKTHYSLYVEDPFRSEVESYLFQGTTSDPQRFDEVTQAINCILHVVTKHLIEKALLEARALPESIDEAAYHGLWVRLVDGLKTRQVRKLPDIRLANDGVYHAAAPQIRQVFEHEPDAYHSADGEGDAWD